MKKILLILLAFLLSSTKCYAVTTLTRTVCPSGCDNTSLNAAIDWIQANHADMVSDDVRIDVPISGSWSSDDTATVDITSITTDATHDINIYTTGAARHAGIIGANNHRIVTPNFGSHAININTNAVTIDGLILKAGAFNNGIQVSYSGACNIVIKNNIVHDTWTQGIRSSNGNGGIKIFNNLTYGNGEAGIYFYGNNGSSDGEIYGNTVYDNGNTGISVSLVDSGTIIKNNLCIDNTTSDLVPGSATVGTNGTSDSTGTSGLQSLSASTEFTNSGSFDFHLKAGATSIDSGTDLGSPYNVDYEGDARSGSWDLGADEVSGGSPPSTFKPRIINL